MRPLLKIILYLLLLNTSITCFGQDGPSFDKMTDVLLPAPNATAIIRNAEASLNKNTGAASVSIPLYTLKGNKLSTSVSLGYGSNGIRVDDIASRVGMGWSLNAGGVITRTVRGLADERNNRIVPWATIGENWPTFGFCYRVTGSLEVNDNGYDPEPDLFNYSFDGSSGSFVLDNNMAPVLIGQNGYKIEKNFTPNATWNFKITTTAGITYVFGGADATEMTKRTTSCTRGYSQYVSTAWYLIQIQHPNGEVINFSYLPIEYQYDNGVVQTMYYRVPASYCQGPIIYNTTCSNVTKVSGVKLQTITVPGVSSAGFGYTSRNDCNDQLVSSVTYKDPANTVSHFDLTYDNVYSSSGYNNETQPNNNRTPYLMRIDEKSANNTFTKSHHFSYIAPDQRPSRLSFSQDTWGYFNGKVNAALVPPQPGYAYNASYFPLATANRDPDFQYTQKGMLKTIVYPTGGITSFFYEPNTYEGGNIDTRFTTKHELNCDVTGSGDWNVETREQFFHTTISADVKLYIESIANGPINPPHSQHVRGEVEIYDVTTNTIVYTNSFGPGYNNETTNFVFDHDYRLTVKSYGSLITTKVKLTYYPSHHTPSVTQIIGPGVRVARIVSSAAPESGSQSFSGPSNYGAIVKKYFYGPLTDLNKSSLVYLETPSYLGFMLNPVSCSVTGGIVSRNYYSLSSNSSRNLGIFNNSQLSYDAVTESEGENFEGGGTEYRFLTGIDVKGEQLLMNEVIGSALSNFSSLANGRPKSETVVKKMPNGDLKPIRRTEYTYQDDSATKKIVYGYAVGSPVGNGGVFPDTTCDINDPTPIFGGLFTCLTWMQLNVTRYNVMRYHIISSRINPETTTTTSWDENGENPQVTVNHSYFDNSNHYQLTKTEAVNSKGQTIRNSFKYPHDYTGTGDYTAMVNANIISPVVNIRSDIVNGSTVLPASEVKTEYANMGNNNYEVSVLKKSVKGSIFETEGTIELYDSSGHILQYKGKDDIVNSIIWGYNNQYPVAKITGATYSQATAQLTVTLTSLQSMDGQALRDELNHIRTGLSTALVTTYTYKHLAGISSVTDPGNRTNTYLYDDFNRLLLVKDQDGNAVKKLEYQYATPDPTATLMIYYNAALTVSKQCQTCESGYSSAPISYTVPAGRYYSLISQAAADALAAGDAGVPGQIYADKNSVCSNNLSCTGTGYKFVNCSCELWQKVCVSSVNNNNGTYTVTYYYQWSDGSNTGTPIIETIACSGIDKKVINCTCETAIKVYESSEFCFLSNEGGCCSRKWLCGFYYKWSDNSTLYNTGNTLFYECADESCMNEAEELYFD